MYGYLQLHITGVLCLIFPHMTSSTVTVKYWFHSFSNPNHKDFDGDKCDYGIGHHCDHAFTMCFDQYSGSSSVAICPLGRYNTAKYRNQDTVIFGDEWRDPSNHVITNPVTINMDQWNGIKLKLQIIDDDSIGNHDLVDTYDTTYFGRAHDWDSELDETYQTETYTGMRTTSTPTSLVVKISVRCDKDYYGTNCDAYCPEEDRPYVSAINNCRGDVPREEAHLGPVPAVVGATMHEEKSVSALIIGLICSIFIAVLVVIIAVALVYKHKRNKKLEQTGVSGEFDNPVYSEQRSNDAEVQNAINNRHITSSTAHHVDNRGRTYPNLDRTSTSQSNIYAITDQGAVGGDPVYDNHNLMKKEELIYDVVDLPTKKIDRSLKNID